MQHAAVVVNTTVGTKKSRAVPVQKRVYVPAASNAIVIVVVKAKIAVERVKIVKIVRGRRVKRMFRVMKSWRNWSDDVLRARGEICVTDCKFWVC